MATSEYQLGEVPNSHSQRGQKASQACGLGNLSPSSDSELYGQGDLKKNHFIHTDAIISVSKSNPCGL